MRAGQPPHRGRGRDGAPARGRRGGPPAGGAHPPAFSKLFRGPGDWAYYTEEQPHLDGRRLYWPRGKMLGGSSSMNAMVYVRGNPADYDAWARVGCEGWAWERVLPYFLRAERREGGASEHHGAAGPLGVADLRCVNPLSRAFVEACAELGIPRNPDFNGARQDGAGFYQVTQSRGRRHSAADAYLRPALGRPTLTVRTHAHATRVLFEGTRAAPFAPFRGAEAYPGAGSRSDADLARYVRRHAETLYHPVGTCRMGGGGDADAVLDARLRVRGVEGLRVVDASVMPTIVRGNTNAPTIMIAERGADLIRGGVEAGAFSLGAVSLGAAAAGGRAPSAGPAAEQRGAPAG